MARATMRVPVIRCVGVVLASCLLGITLLTAVLTRHVSCSAREPEAIAELFASPEMIDHGYDALLPAALHDRLGRRAGVPEATPIVVREIMEVVWPRHVARAQVEQLIEASSARIADRETPAAIRIGPTAEGWGELPNALGQALDHHAIEEQLVDSLVAPRLRARIDDVLVPTLGISLSAEQSRAAAHKILAPTWVRAQVVDIAEAMVPYLRGDAEEFEARIELASRVPVARDILHERLVEARAARRLVRDRIIDPFVENALARAGELPLGIELSATELQSTILASIPAGWFSRKSWVVLDAFSRYLSGESDVIAFEIPLAERNAALAPLLVDLLRTKLADRFAGLAPCSRRQLFAAVRALRRARLPECVPGTGSFVEEIAGQRIEVEVGRIIERLPAQLSFDHADVTARLGSSRMMTIDAMRQRVREGLPWTNEDFERLVGASSSSRQPVDTALAAVRGGTVAAPDVEALVVEVVDESMRGLVGVGFGAIRHPWVLELVALASLGIVVLAVGGDTRRRVLWSCWALSLVAATDAILVAATSWPTSADVGAWMHMDAESWPRLGPAMRDGPLPHAIAEWIRDWRSSIAASLLPWTIVGPLAHAVVALRDARMKRQLLSRP